MLFKLSVFSGLSIGIGVCIGWLRFYKMDRSYLPFLLLLTLGFISELGSLAMVKHHGSNIAILNIYSLAEVLLFLWQFNNWQSQRPYRRKLLLTTFAAVAFWAAEWMYRGTLWQPFSGCIILFAATLIFLSMAIVVRQLYPLLLPLRSNALFIIGLGLIFCNTCTVITETCWLLLPGTMAAPMRAMVVIFAAVNFLSNLLFIWSIFYIPPRFRYIFRSSSAV
ncbi:hypothetical protein [Niabella aurantiaca]|uniref:hypothetical protein n=1 Tax=Niabella aurantiaca TaxID=379900 RepID=UPI00037CE4FB|nr:hypothetical protein [Niabella aurantiaca]